MEVFENLSRATRHWAVAGTLMASALFSASCGKKAQEHEPESQVSEVESLARESLPPLQKAGNRSWELALHAPAKYSSDDIWYQRMHYLEGLCVLNTPENNLAQRLLLERIKHLDGDRRVKELAGEMISSLSAAGDFSQTEPYRSYQAENQRLKIHVHPDNPYRTEAIWYDRLDQVEILAKLAAADPPPEWIKEDLLKITNLEDDWRIAARAQEILTQHALQKTEASPLSGR